MSVRLPLQRPIFPPFPGGLQIRTVNSNVSLGGQTSCWMLLEQKPDTQCSRPIYTGSGKFKRPHFSLYVVISNHYTTLKHQMGRGSLKILKSLLAAYSLSTSSSQLVKPLFSPFCVGTFVPVICPNAGIRDPLVLEATFVDGFSAMRLKLLSGSGRAGRRRSRHSG